MGKPVISVIMATYNHAPFVGEAVSSVLEQTFANFEFLILDDGSTDSTPDRVRAFSDPRIRFTAWPRNRGACAAINTLLDACRGEYICLLNSDDRFLPNKLERQMLFLRSHPELSFCFTWAELIDDFGRPYVDDRHFYYGLFDQLPRTRQAWLRRFFWEGNCLCHPTIMARRKDYTLRFDERLCKLPDLHMWVRLARRYELGMLPERLTQFRILPGEGNASGKKADTLALIQLELPLILEEYLSLSEEDCRAVFGLTGDPIARAFAAYRAALSLSPAAQSWGFSGLYRLLGDPRSREALAKLGFDQTTLFQLGGQSDVYSVLPHRATLYFADRDTLRHAPSLPAAFSEERMYSLPAASREAFSHTFLLERPVAALRFDPCESPCQVQLTRADLLLSHGRRLNLLPILKHNGQEVEGGVRFAHFDPSIYFQLPMELPCEGVEIAGNWAFLDPSSILLASKGP